MASLAYHLLEEVDRKIKVLMSQLNESGEMKHKDVIALKDELASKTFKEEVLIDSEDETKSVDNTEVLLSVVSSLYELIECLEKKVSTLSRDVKELKEKVKEATEELEALKGDHIKLILGQLAFEVEKAIVNEVLTEVIGSPDEYFITTIADMQNALMRQANFADVFTDDSNCERATKKWKDLQKTLDWKDYHFRCISYLKYSRVSVAHPKFEVSTIRKAINDDKVGQHKKACTELLMMLDKLTK
jgi:regulator of replication initiation timing